MVKIIKYKQYYLLLWANEKGIMENNPLITQGQKI